MRLSRRAALGGLAALLLPACSRGGPAGPRTLRVVSISPSTTEAVFALGAGSFLVGRSRYCDYPPEAEALPVVGGFSDPSVETIVALRPTLVAGAHGPAGPALEQALGARGIATYFPETESFAQIEAMITGLGQRVAREAEARALVATIEAARAAVTAAVKGRPKTRALFLFDVAPPVAAGPGGFPDELIAAAGGENLVKAGGAYPTLDIERILGLDPDVILDGSMDAPEGTDASLASSRVAALKDAPGWRSLRALREGRVRPLSAGSVLRPGPRIGEGLRAVARALHGDAIFPRATP